MKIKKLFELNHFKQNSFKKKGDALYPKYILSSFMGKFTVQYMHVYLNFPVKATGFHAALYTSLIKFLQSYLLSV